MKQAIRIFCLIYGIFNQARMIIRWLGRMITSFKGDDPCIDFLISSLCIASTHLIIPLILNQL